jgi:REP element-mobilizing transposase RayT
MAREIIFKNSLWLQTPRTVSIACVCFNAGTLHLLLTPAQDATLARVMELIKGGYSHSFGAEFGHKKEDWQRGFTDHRIRDAHDFAAHREYIHQNPVKRRLLQNAEEYRYCSAFPGFQLDMRASAAEAA